MGWGNKWEEEIKIELIPPSIGLPADQWGSSSGVIFREMSIKEFEETFPANTEQLVKAYARVLNNKKPTHDPYTNPDAHIYYECACGAILDPQTKSFAQLNNCASEKGWKIRFTDKGYVPYCVKCGEGVE